ncbi:hypothetical protein K3495_g15921, partial [Podosphaera aphanis]
MKFGLPSGLTNEELIHHKIRSACEDHPALSDVCNRSSATVHGLVSDLHASAMKYDRCQIKLKKAGDTYITDRQYNVNRVRQQVPQQSRKQFNKFPSGCIVCKKLSCWSKNHPKHEIDEAFRKLKNNAPAYEKAFQQYVLECEETQFQPENSTIDDLFTEFPEQSNDKRIDPYTGTDSNTTSPEHHFSEIFFATEASFEGQKAIQTLYDRKIRHSMLETFSTTQNFDNEDEEGCHSAQMSESWIVSPRYGDHTFLGIIVDTGAAEHSTGGFKQFTALQKLHSDLRLDTSSTCTFKFGKGSATSMGAATIETPIGPVVFYIVELDLPFLLSLKDMDDRGVYFNNLKNLICKSNDQSIG